MMVSIILLLAAHSALAVGPRVDIVIGEKAPPLEKRAAEDVAADLKKIYDADVKIATAAPEGAENVIFIGSPKTNEQTARQIPESWPKLTEQGHVLRSIKFHGKPALFIGGGSPVAAYWGAAEYAHRLGIRSMLYGDLYPVAPPAFSLEGYDVVVEPLKKDRVWQTLGDFRVGFEMWGVEEHKRLLRQRARLKYNVVFVTVRSWQPFVHFEVDGVKKQTGVLSYGWEFSVKGDTAGRSAFKGAKLFENPDFAGTTTYEQRIAAGQKLVHGIIDEAHSLGMSVGLSSRALEFPKEFAVLLPGAQPVPEPVELAIRPGVQKPNDQQLLRMVKAQLQAYKDTYPKLDKVIAPKFERMPFWPVTDDNLAVYWNSRQNFDASLSSESACRDLVTPICGAGVDGSAFKAHDQIYIAADLIERFDLGFFSPVPDIVMKHYSNTDPPPEWWSKVRANYLGAMNDMYRANSRAREGGRSYTLYLARRCEFGYEYMNCVEAVRKAGIAKSKKDTAEQRAQLEKAVESMNAACSALAAVARDQSDRGMIAVCNEFGYRPLQKELEKMDE